MNAPPAGLPVPGLWNDIAVDLARRGHLASGLAAMRRAVMNAPDDPKKRAELHSNHANMLRRMGRRPESFTEILHALALDGKNQPARFNYAVWQMEGGQHETAIAQLDELLLEEPGNHDWRFARACCLLGSGRFAEGFEAYEVRLEDQRFGTPFWDARAARPGHRVLVSGEQGLGDTIMYHRFVETFRATYPEIVVDYVVHQQLATLLGAERAGAVVGTPGKSDEWHIPVMSIPRALGITEVSGEPYLKPLHRMGVPEPPGTRYKIGLVWRAKTTIKSMTVDEGLHGNAKSMPLEILLELTRIKGAALYGLQHNATDIADLEAGHVVNNLGHMLHDFTDLASYIAQMDVLVTVDTAPAHLGGALGIPTVVCLHNRSAWHWGTGERTPWYNSTRALHMPGRWDAGAIVAEVEKCLATKI